MNQEQLNTALYEKMAAEQNEYRDWLKSQSPEEVLSHAYEYAMREDMVMEMEELDLSEEQAEVLLASPSPLADLYDEFRDMESRHMEDIRDCIEGRANNLIKEKLDYYL